MLSSVTATASKFFAKHGPAIGTAAGIAGFAATAVVASRATLKAQKHWEDHKTSLHVIDEVAKKGETVNGEPYSDKDRKTDNVKCWSILVKDMIKVYAPAVAMGVASATAIAVSFNTLQGRLNAVVSAYNALSVVFGEYRDRVVERYGEEVDEEVMKSTGSDVVTDKKGAVKEFIAPEMPKDGTIFWYNEDSSTNWTKSQFENLTFLRAQEKVMNRKLQRRGFIFLNDILEELGFEAVPYGQAVGWVWHPGDEESSWINFGINNIESDEATDMVVKESINESDVYLDFNVQGVIWDLI